MLELGLVICQWVLYALAFVLFCGIYLWCEEGVDDL